MLLRYVGLRVCHSSIHRILITGPYFDFNSRGN